MKMNKLLPTVWLMFTRDGFYPIQPSWQCRPDDHAALNAHIIRIEDPEGNVLWNRSVLLSNPENSRT
jgi:hypothetical protein